MTFHKDLSDSNPDHHSTDLPPGSSPRTSQHFPRSTAMFSGTSSLGGVLVVDDESDVRRVIRITLEKAGYHVLEAKDGEEAIQVLSTGEHPILVDTIITDIRMPNINGVEAIAFFQKEYPSIPLIVLTAHPDLQMAIGFLGTGVVDYLVKPVEGTTLKTTVARAVAQRQMTLL